MIRTLLLSAATIFGFQASALAQPATVTTDLALRTGPGLTYPVIDVIAPSDIVQIEACVDRGLWCHVSWAGTSGWVYAAFLVRERPELRSTPLAETRRFDRRTLDGRPFDGRALDGRSIGRGYSEQWASVPREAVPFDASPEITVAPPARIENYVMTNRIPPVRLKGEAVVDATLPASLKLHAIPGYRYRYAYVNDKIVLADPDTYRIVHVFN